MLCPRCNSENETGTKFCKFCGSPLVDTDLFLDQNTLKKRDKERKKEEKKLERQNRRKEARPYRRPIFRIFFRFISSLILIIVLAIAGVYLLNFVNVKMSNDMDTYKAKGVSIPSIKYVINNREVTEVKYSYVNNIFKKSYVYGNVEDAANDLIKYVSYLMEHEKFELLTPFNPAQPGSARLVAESTSTIGYLTVVDIDFTDSSYTITVYADQSIKLK